MKDERQVGLSFYLAIPRLARVSEMTKLRCPRLVAETPDVVVVDGVQARTITPHNPIYIVCKNFPSRDQGTCQYIYHRVRKGAYGVE